MATCEPTHPTPADYRDAADDLITFIVTAYRPDTGTTRILTVKAATADDAEIYAHIHHFSSGVWVVKAGQHQVREYAVEIDTCTCRCCDHLAPFDLTVWATNPSDAEEYAINQFLNSPHDHHSIPDSPDDLDVTVTDVTHQTLKRSA